MYSYFEFIPNEPLIFVKYTSTPERYKWATILLFCRELDVVFVYIYEHLFVLFMSQVCIEAEWKDTRESFEYLNIPHLHQKHFWDLSL